MRKFLIWLSGARWKVLEQCPGDRAKYEGIGAAIFFTSAIAGVSMTFALDMALKAPLPLAIVGGLAWGLAIMQLDRWMVVSIQRRDKPWQNLYTALPRLVLALLFGVVISTPLVLQVFRPEIEAQMVQMRQHDADAFKQQQQTGAVGKSVAGLTAQRDALQKIISSGGDAPQNPEADPKIIGLRTQLAAAQAASDKAYNEWQCQLYGPCKPTGPGPLATAAQQVYNTARNQVDTINGQIEERKRQLSANDNSSRTSRVTDAQAQLPQVQSQLATSVQQQQALQQSFDAKSRGSSGLLMRIKALDEISKQNSTLDTARLLLLLFITSIECLPVLVKLLLTFGPENNYERISRMEEAWELESAGLNIRKRKVSAEEGELQVLNEIWGDPDGQGPEGTRRIDLDADDGDGLSWGSPRGQRGPRGPRGAPGGGPAAGNGKGPRAFRSPEYSPFADEPDPYASDNTGLMEMPDEREAGFDDFDPPPRRGARPAGPRPAGASQDSRPAGWSEDSRLEDSRPADSRLGDSRPADVRRDGVPRPRGAAERSPAEPPFTAPGAKPRDRAAAAAGSEHDELLDFDDDL